MMVWPINRLSLRWRHHFSALWWLGLLYRNPQKFKVKLEDYDRWTQVSIGTQLFLHSLPYFCLVGVAGGLFLSWAQWTVNDVAIVQIIAAISAAIAAEIAVGFAIGIGFGIDFGIAGVLAGGIGFGIAGGIAGIFGGIPGIFIVGIVIGTAVGIVSRIADDEKKTTTTILLQGISRVINCAIFFIVAVGICFEFGFKSVGVFVGMIALEIAVGLILGVVTRIAGRIFGTITIGVAVGIGLGIVGGIGLGIIGGIVFIVASGIALYRLLHYIIHFLFMARIIGARRYPFHPAAWDSLCAIPFYKLDTVLANYSIYDKDAAEAEIERLILDYPIQRVNALRAKTILLAQQSGEVNDLTQLNALARSLPEGAKGFDSQTRLVRAAAALIARHQAHLNSRDRPLFRETLAKELRAEIIQLRNRINGFSQPLRTLFREAAENWLTLAEKQLDAIQKNIEQDPHPTVFRAGDPVKKESTEAFVPRMSVIDELERQIMFSTGCPGILVYGRRRIGKSTLLKNLAGEFLPPTVGVVNLSMQDPRLFSSLENFIEAVCKELYGQQSRLLDGEMPGQHSAKTLSDFMDVASMCNQALIAGNRRILLTIDEYEKIDQKIGAYDSDFKDDLLATIRESIQIHSRITWLFAGSHEIDRLAHADWTSYFVGLRTVIVEPFSEHETRLLLTDPLKHSSTWGKNPKRPRFETAFWGAQGIEQIHYETAGWPNFVQLLADTLLELVIETKAGRVTPNLYNLALQKVIACGDIVFSELINKESQPPECKNEGEWDYLRGFRAQDTLPLPADFEILRSLKRRLMVVEENGRCRMRVPLMQRWLRERG